MSRADPQVNVRVPPDVKQWLTDQAARNMRSLSAEIVLAIREKMAATGDKIGVTAPVAAETTNRQETIDAAHT